MCLEDLRLGRGRQVDKPVVFNDTGASVQILQPDARRVAILISPQTVNGSIVTITADNAGTIPLFSLIDAVGVWPLVLRIEDLGQLITGSLFGGLSATNAGFVFTPIYTNENSYPIP